MEGDGTEFSLSQSQLYFSKPPWSERIIILGKGVVNWSTKYKNLTFCIAGIGESSDWLRLFPIACSLYSDIKPFDVVQAIIRDSTPEPHRSESRKVVFGREYIRVVDRLDREPQIEILTRYTENGEFLHGEGWRAKSLGMIKPRNVRLKVSEDKLRVNYKCDYKNCNGHLNKAFPFLKFDRVGRKTLNIELIERIESCDEDDLRFVMGTVSTHPQKWILIHIHTF